MEHVADYDYDLPPHLIAQEPLPERDRARLMVLDRATGALDHRRVADLPDLLVGGDLVVLNNTRVLKARLLGRRETTGGKWEGLFLRATAGGAWELLAQTRGTLRPGEWIAVDPGPLRLRLEGKTAEGHFLMRPEPDGPPEELLERCGRVPLPPYVRKGRAAPGDGERYQTVYARSAGSVAAPTAGLHFTPELFARLAARGVRRAEVTLHVGAGTFKPLQGERLADNVLHAEWGEVPAATAEAVRACRAGGGRVVAVGTTTTRILETAARGGTVLPWSGDTRLFITPGFAFRAVDVLLTNFHLPRSSLLALVAAFAGLAQVRHAYRVAVAEGYRFYSYGDAMLIR